MQCHIAFTHAMLANKKRDITSLLSRSGVEMSSSIRADTHDVPG